VGNQLPADVFRTVIEKAPLVSIDLLIVDDAGQLLVGKRVNEPARGFFFVPGGRIVKGERHEDALRRIAADEVGIEGLEWRDENVVGVFTHVYDANALEVPGVSTHYAVIGYRAHVAPPFELPTGDDQHSAFRWIGRKDAHDATIHPNTLAYLDRLDPPLTPTQYEVLNARRDTANSLVWQTPVVGLTGLAFIFTVLLAGDTSWQGRWIAAALAVSICVATLHLTAKQRFTEVEHAKLGEAFERAHRMYPLNEQLKAPTPYLELSSVRVWRWLFVALGVAAVASAITLSFWG